MGQGNFPKFKIDEELGLLGPLHQRLYMEDPSANNYNDTNMMRASGESFSNFFDAKRPYVPVYRCKNHCESLFAKGEEKTLREACKSMCKSKCKPLSCSVSPTRESVCLSRGLNADCTPKVAPEVTPPEVPLTAASSGGGKSMGAAPQAAQETTNKAASTSTNKTLLIVGVIVGVSVLGLIAFKAFKK